MRLPVDIIVLVLSHTSSSILCGNGTGCILRAEIGPSDPEVIVNESSDSLEVDVDMFRDYWAVLRLSGVGMEEAAAKLAQEDYVSARLNDQTFKVDDFHSWLVLARLLALSHGQSSITTDIWTRMRELERARLHGSG